MQTFLGEIVLKLVVLRDRKWTFFYFFTTESNLFQREGLPFLLTLLQQHKVLYNALDRVKEASV